MPENSGIGKDIELAAAKKLAEELYKSRDYKGLESVATQYGLKIDPSTSTFHQEPQIIGVEPPINPPGQKPNDLKSM